MEAPIIAHRVRKAALAGAQVSFANREQYVYHFDVAEYAHGDGLVAQLAGIAVAAAGKKSLPASVAKLCAGVSANEAQKNIAKSLAEATQPMVLTGLIAGRHQAFSAVRALADAIAEMTGARFGSLSESANSAGACLAGVLPHRLQGGKARANAGLNTVDMLDEALDLVMMFGCEPDDVRSVPDAVKKLAAQKFVVAFTPFESPQLAEAADLMLPIGTFAETSGTFVNCEGRWQSFAGIANPLGEARPGWKVLRVLGNLLNAENFEYQTSEDVRDEIAGTAGDIKPEQYKTSGKLLPKVNGADAADQQLDVPIYRVDGLVRRATALQLTPEGRRSASNNS
jgi:NADH-quinone oxidoreductase subunit G